MSKKNGNSKNPYPDLISPLDAKLPKGDPRFPVNNPACLHASDPLSLVPGGGSKKGKY